MQKVLFSLSLIIAGLLAGYLWQLRIKKKRTDHETYIRAISKLLQKIALFFIFPISFVAAVWIVSFEDVRVVWLPVICIAVLLLGGLISIMAARLLNMENRQKGTLYCCGSFSNLGAVGGLVAFIFLGEAGFALLALYRMFEEMSYYTIGFPVARYYGGDENKTTFGKRFVAISKDPFLRAAIGAFSLGLIFNLSGVQRPLFLETLNGFIVPIGTFILLLSIGLGIRFSKVSDYYIEGAVLSFIKFIAAPIIGVTIAYLIGLNEINGGLPLKVVLVASSMPVGIIALVTASIYDLDLDLANSCWLITTGGLVIVLPLLYFLLELF